MSDLTSSASAVLERDQLVGEYERVRSTTMALCEPLEPEDMVVQTMPDVSPTKWHLAHVTWFFEAIVLDRADASYVPFDDRYHALFNSYYQTLGNPYPRAQRGQLSRPTVDEVGDYRRHVDRAVTNLLENGPAEAVSEVAPIVTLGLHHEQQHQELLLMDVKHVLARNPLRPAYRARPRRTTDGSASSMGWRRFGGGQIEVGSPAGGFAYDNETPRHTVLVEPFELATRVVTASEYREFMAAGGYDRPELWLADGWETAQREGWRAPLYWEDSADGWQVMTLGGLRPVEPNEPVCHVSYFEADAFATWAGCRLPTEFEWEHAAQGERVAGTFLESREFHPRPAELPTNGPPAQLFGDVWEWTSSPYAPYPGYVPFEGALGEYNGKFMINQMVLRGGCCVSPRRHVRETYRNFYYPHQRWMFAGLRLARGVGR